jgi:hypothetical protein
MGLVPALEPADFEGVTDGVGTVGMGEQVSPFGCSTQASGAESGGGNVTLIVFVSLGGL